MTQDFVNMLKLFACGAVGKGFLAEGEFDIENVRSLAIEQSVWQTVFAGISDSVGCGALTVEPKLFSKYKTEVYASVRSSIIKNEFTEKIVKEAGVKYCILKGRSVARLYKYPECRVSSDVDILIEREDAEKWTVYLTQNGYKVEEQSGIKHHFNAVHPIGGLLELHTDMYYKTTENILLKGIVEYSEPYTEIDGIVSLGANDALVYLTAHLMKHFLSGAAGLRQICDLIVYMDSHKADINWEKYDFLMKKLGFCGFISAIKGIGNKYFGMNFEGADTSVIDALLDDTEAGGNFGRKGEGFSKLYYVFLKLRADMTEKEFNKYYDKHSRGTTFARMFPKIESMQTQYPVLKNAPYLIPFYWVVRLLGIGFNVLSGKRKANNLPDEESLVIKQRKELVKKLGLM